MPKYRLLTPGPVAVPERVLLAMAGPVIHHRAPDFVPAFAEVRENLARVFQTREDVLVLASSGTGAMEASVANLLCRGDRAVVVRGGKFGERWGELCEAYGVEVVAVDVEWGQAVEPDAVRAAFERAPEARALLVQASETSTGVYHPIEPLSRLVRERDECLMIVDGISGVGVHDLPMDEWEIDVLVSGSQKSFMLPPGLAFIALSERARAGLERADGPRYYFDLRKEAAMQPKNQTAFTPAVSLILGLRESLRMVLEEGLERVFARHASISRAARAAVTATGLEPFAPHSPSFATTAVRVPEGLDGKELIRRMRDEHSIIIEGGRGHVAGKIFRIGHIGYVDCFDLLAALAAVEMVLADMGYPVKLGDAGRALMEELRDLPAGGT